MSDYVYNSSDASLKTFRALFTSRIGDRSGSHDQDFIEILELVLALKAGGSVIDVGAGHGRMTPLCLEHMETVVALEPDAARCAALKNAFHDPPKCTVSPEFVSAFAQDKSSASFDVALLSMVLQHVPTDAYPDIVGSISTVLKPGGVLIAATTHAVAETKGFTFEKASPEKQFVEEAEFNAYAHNPEGQTKGIPVRRFDQDAFLEVFSTHFKVALWRQYSYYKLSSLRFFCQLYNVPERVLRDVGNCQYAVLVKK
ncbi:MAG: class I SAM-dependent methyltransferase [Pseudomonadota bacterium]